MQGFIVNLKVTELLQAAILIDKIEACIERFIYLTQLTEDRFFDYYQELIASEDYDKID